MNFYSLPPLVCSLIAAVLGFLIYSKNKKSLLNITFALLCLTTFWWQSCWSLLFNTKTDQIALLLTKIGYSGIIFIPITFFHFSLQFNQVKSKKIIAFSAYLIGLIFLAFLWFSDYFISGYFRYSWGLYPKASLLHPFYVIFLAVIVVYCAVLYVISINNQKFSISKRYQSKYLLIAHIIYALAGVDFIVNYDIGFYPPGFIFVIFSLGIIAYAIARYRLMEITIAITRTGIFIAVYTIVLGLPFVLATTLKDRLVTLFSSNWWVIPLSLMAVLATVGPFIFIYLERRAEARLLREQRRYQQTLKQASVGMTRIRNLNKLLNLIAHIVTKTVHISYAAIYLYNRETDEYILQVSRDKGRVPIAKMSSNNSLIRWIVKNRQPLIHEEIKRKMEDLREPIYREIEENMGILNASVVIPSFLEDKSMGFLVLGDKISGQIYTPDDLDVFQVLASQAALAIENAQFYDETKEMQEQIAQAEKMATIGTMADGLSHQINNRFHALSLIAGDTIDTIKMTDTSKCNPEVKEMLSQINYALSRIQTNVLQGGEVVKGILKYTRKGEEGFEPLTLDAILDSTMEMVQFKVKLSEIDIIRNYPKDTPKIHGNIVQLQEVFFNFIDNAYDAIVERRNTLQESDYRGRITVSATPKNNHLEIIVEDNGFGVKEQDYKKVFTPFFTTKNSARKGTGLGLYVIRKIITDTHKGRISFESEYRTGTRFIVELPLAK